MSFKIMNKKIKDKFQVIKSYLKKIIFYLNKLILIIKIIKFHIKLISFSRMISKIIQKTIKKYKIIMINLSF